jgi:ribosomal protein S18 acetylase RimI-like enzyme
MSDAETAGRRACRREAGAPGRGPVGDATDAEVQGRTMIEIELRDLRRADRGAIAEILESAGVFRPEEVAVGLELVDETLHPGPSTDYRWWIAERGGAVVGFACYGPVPLTEGTFDLYWIAVAPAARGTSVAERLDRAATEDVRRAGGRWLLAETSSTPAYAAAHRFYEKQGYRLLEWIADFYRPGDDRLTFGKRLDRG